MVPFVRYFAYGSNLDLAQMRERCPGHRQIGRAWLADHRLCFPRRSPVRKCATAGVEPCAGEGVWGALYELTADDIARLHRSEGYHPDGPPEQNRHRVMHVEVALGGPGGRAMFAYTYIAVPDRSGAVPSPDYMGHLIRGAAHHGLPGDYIAALSLIVTEPTA